MVLASEVVLEMALVELLGLVQHRIGALRSESGHN
jgi:hypothetical protein